MVLSFVKGIFWNPYKKERKEVGSQMHAQKEVYFFFHESQGLNSAKKWGCYHLVKGKEYVCVQSNGRPLGLSRLY